MSAPTQLPNGRRVASTATIWTALCIVYAAWSTTFVGISVANETIPPMLAGGLRFLVAGGLLLPIAASFGDRVGDRPTATQWKGAAVVALFMMFGGNGGIVRASTALRISGPLALTSSYDNSENAVRGPGRWQFAQRDRMIGAISTANVGRR